MKSSNIEKVSITSGTDGGRGWKGDVKNMLLDIGKIKTLGWKPKHNTEPAIAKIVKKCLLPVLFEIPSFLLA